MFQLWCLALLEIGLLRDRTPDQGPGSETAETNHAVTVNNNNKFHRIAQVDVLLSSVPGQAGGFCCWPIVMMKTKGGSWSTFALSPIVFVVGIVAVATIFPGGEVVVAVDNFLTDGTVAPSVVPPGGGLGLQDCDAFFGISTPDDCTAACGRFLLNFQIYTVDWVEVEESDQENENNEINNSVGVDDDNVAAATIPIDDDSEGDDDENLVLSSAAAAAAYIEVQKFDANTRTNGLRKLYAGFVCQCPNNPDQSINCVYRYDFPSCRAVGVVDCSDIDLTVSNTEDPPPPPISVTLAPAIAPEPPSSSPSAESDYDLSQILNDTAIHESTIDDNDNATFTNATERFRYQWRRRRILSKRNLQGFDDESDILLDGMFNTTEVRPGSNDTGGSTSSASIVETNLGDRNNVTSLISGNDIVNNYGNNNTVNASSIQDDFNKTSASNSNASSNSNSTRISCASFCHSLGMDVGANSAGQTSKTNINNKATRTICATNPGDDIDDGNSSSNSNSTVVLPWVACACNVRSVFSTDGSSDVYITEGFYVCGDEGFNSTGIVLGSSGSVGGHHIRRNNLLGGVGILSFLLIQTTVHVLY